MTYCLWKRAVVLFFSAAWLSYFLSLLRPKEQFFPRMASHLPMKILESKASIKRKPKHLLPLKAEPKLTTLHTLRLVFIFSLLFSLHFLRHWRGTRRIWQTIWSFLSFYWKQNSGMFVSMTFSDLDDDLPPYSYSCQVDWLILDWRLSHYS